MQPPLIPLNEDHKWKLLSEILNVFDSRASRQILSRKGIFSLHKSVPALKIVLLSMFFSRDISYVVKEVFNTGKVLVTTVERVNVKMLMTAFCFNLHQLKTLKHKGII